MTHRMKAGGFLCLTLILMGCGSPRTDAPQTSAHENAGAVTAPTSPAADTAAALTPVPPPSGEGDLRPLPSATRPSLEPRPLDQTADVGGGVSVRLVSVRAVEVTGRGPGEIGGPGLAVNVEVKNASPTVLDIDGLTVTLSYGELEASPVTIEPTQAVTGPVPAGATVAGTYAFTVPKKDQESILIRVGVSASHPVVLFSR